MDQDPKTSTPRPDPTALTVDALKRDIGAVKDVLRAQRKGDMRWIKEKFRGMNHQIQLIVAMGSKGVETKVDAVEARLDRGDGKIVGQAYRETGGQQVVALILAVVAILISIAGTVAAFLRH